MNSPCTLRLKPCATLFLNIDVRFLTALGFPFRLSYLRLVKKHRFSSEPRKWLKSLVSLSARVRVFCNVFAPYGLFCATVVLMPVNRIHCTRRRRQYLFLRGMRRRGSRRGWTRDGRCCTFVCCRTCLRDNSWIGVSVSTEFWSR